MPEQPVGRQDGDKRDGYQHGCRRHRHACARAFERLKHDDGESAPGAGVEHDSGGKLRGDGDPGQHHAGDDAAQHQRHDEAEEGAERRDAEVASRALGQRLEVLMASNAKELEAAFSALKQRSAGALIIASDQFYFGRMREIAMLAGRQAFRLLGRYGSLPRKAG